MTYFHSHPRDSHNLSENQKISVHNRGFPKIDHSGIDARIVLEQINSAKKLGVTGLTSCVQAYAFLLTELSGQVLIQGSLTQLLCIN